MTHQQMTHQQMTHQIGAEERRRFAEDGWLLIPGALPRPLLHRLTEATDRIYAQEALGGRLGPDHRLHLLGFVDRDDTFLELLDPPSTFPYVWGLLGWNIFAYHTHLDVNPTVEDPGPPFWGWHQDGGRQNLEIETEPRPRLAVKVAYVLSDMSRPGRGNTRIIPGSHLRNRLPRPERPELGFEEPEGAVEVCAKPGDAFVFDRRLWHSRSVNTSGITRKIAFVGYTYRWVRPREELALDRDPAWWEQVSPVRRQLLGHGRDPNSFWGLGKDTYPLKETLATQGMLDPSVPPQR
jgi:hypothetical protein